MSRPITREEDVGEYPYARDGSLSGRAADILSPPQRAHPYSRRPSLPMLDNGPRIHLPPPTQDGPGRSDAPRTMPTSQSQPVNIPGISSLALRDGPWQRGAERERFWEDRSRQSERARDERVVMARTASTGSGHPHQVRLPPLHSLSSSEPYAGESAGFGPTSSVMPPPPRPRTNPPSPRFAYARPTSPRLMSSNSLRPSYSTHAPPNDRREVSDYPPSMSDRSPPLRSVHTYGSPGPYPPPPPHYPVANDRHAAQAYHGHHQRHPAPFVNRNGHHSGYVDSPRRPEEERATPSGAGQSRRLAHLMSEQKRRESINTGFVGLRKVVPTAAITDSKAVILRKAAAHIMHLEALLSSRHPRSGAATREGSENRYREVSDERDDSDASSESDNRQVKREREGSDENDWGASA